MAALPDRWRGSALVAGALVHLAVVAQAQGEGARTVRPERWPEAGRFPVPAWVVALVGGALLVLAIVALVRRMRR